MKILEKISEFFTKIIKCQKLTPSDLIQIGVLIALGITIYITNKNIEQQGEFSRNTFRPWLYVEPQKAIEITDCRVIFWYDLKCEGESPSYNIVRYEAITFDSVFPVRIFKELKRNSIDELEKIGLIAPGATERLDDNCIIDFEDRIPKDSLIREINRSKLFVHIYLEYSDFKNNQYCFRYTSRPEGLNEYAKNQYNCEWSNISAQEECIK